MRNTVSIKDVACEAGTSIATVSNVLNQKNNVSPALTQRVLDAAERLGYRTNTIARSLKTHSSRVVGVIFSDLGSIFPIPQLGQILDGLNANGYAMQICDCKNDLSLEAGYANMLMGRQVDAIIRNGIGGTGCEEIYERIVKSGTPVVSIEHDYTAQGVDSVLVNNREAACRAVKHLLEIGCRRIVHISFMHRVNQAYERFMGYMDALTEAGIPFDEQLVASGDFTAFSGYRAAQKLIHSGMKFDGVFAANDQMALGALRALHDAGISVPRDVKIVGYDNTFIASIVDPSLTVISVSSADLGRLAVNRALERLKGLNTKAVRIPLDYDLIIRESTMTSAHARWDIESW